MNTAIATRHRDDAYRRIVEAGQDVIVRPPIARSTATDNTERVFGSATYETAYGTSVTVNAWVHNTAVPTTFQQGPVNQGAALLGMLAESDLILSLKLSDALVDSTVLFGRTIFDQAKDVQVSGSTFEVSGTFRSGFAPIGPYILWVGLVNSGE